MFSVLRVVLRKVFFTFSVCLMSYVINKVMWCVKRLCVVSICVCILLCVYVYVMFNVVCVLYSSCVCCRAGGDWGRDGGDEKHCRGQIQARDTAQGSRQSSHTDNTSQHHVQSLLCR